MTCPECGGPVVQTGGRGRPRKYDKPECERAAQIRVKAARRAAGTASAGDRSKTGMRDPLKRRRAEELIAEGHNAQAVADKSGLSPDSVREIGRRITEPQPLPQDGESPDGPVLPDTPGRLIPFEPPAEALRALEDFGYFRQRYFGRVPTPWQIDAALHLRDALAAPEKTYVVLNAPPGSGKSTLFVHDVLAWLACRDRSVRVLIGSRTYRQATAYTARLRRTFSRVSLAPVSSEQVAQGLAVQPESTLPRDFGRFQPWVRSDKWADNEFVLIQADETVAVSEKEASFAAYGMDSGFLGGRFDVVVWDDLVDSKTLKTPEGRAQLIRQYEDEMETRVEPGGLLVLQGQRMAANDLYRHCLDMRVGESGPGSTDDERTKKYRHIVYRSHDDSLCRGDETHGSDAPAWPDGCLLDPKRLPWWGAEGLSTIRESREKYQVLYQQEDVDPASVLVPRIWIDGGRDLETGEVYLGCWDKQRAVAEIPKGLAAPTYSIVTVDPSASNYWAIQWWCYNPASEQRFLLDQIRQKMAAPEFLDFDFAAGVHTGVMEEWQARSVDLGLPIQFWIVESNAAQRFLLQYDHVQTWRQKHKTSIVPHQTQRNKTDAEFGVQSVSQHWRYGRVRLPGYGEVSRRTVAPLIDEVTCYPDSTTTDCVMASWFLEWQIPRLCAKQVISTGQARRPSWVGSGATRGTR